MSDVKDDGVSHSPTLWLTAAQLAAIAPRSPAAHRQEDAHALSEAMREAQITTLARVSAFLGQILHECDELRYVREIWGPTGQQLRYERRMDQPWDKAGLNSLAYRLNNNQPGDGFTFRGWGWMQTTGRANTMLASLAIFGDGRLILHPEMLDDRTLAPYSATYYWTKHNLNALADAGDQRAITLRVNGAATDGAPSHHLRRLAYHDSVIKVLAGVLP